MHICPLSLALRICRKIGLCRNTGIRTYFGSVTVESVKVFRHFAFWRYGTRLATFCIAPNDCIIWGASFEPGKYLATLVPEEVQGFHGTHLYHCYTLLTLILALTHTHTHFRVSGRQRQADVPSVQKWRSDRCVCTCICTYIYMYTDMGV